MAFELDDSIREDFLVEGSEIIEKVVSELAQLERHPDDHHLLNSIFRGFHTIKGGAGFLDIEPLVRVCHGAEEVFDSLRSGKLSLDSEIMDAIFQAVDSVVDILGVVSSGKVPEPVTPALLNRLLECVPSAQASGKPPSALPVAAPADDIADLEFDAIIDEVRAEIFIDPEVVAKKTDVSVQAGPITDDEFEALLDQFQGKESTASASAMACVEAAAEVVVERDSVPDREPPAVAPKRDSGARESSIRVSVSRLDSVMNLVGELVLVRNRLTNLGADLGNEELKRSVANLNLVTADLQDGVMQTRMQPIGQVFSRFPRLARDVAQALNKAVELSISGEDTDLDKNLVQALSDPLVHLVRNAIDHGIEASDVRQANGKPRTGTVELSAQQEGNHVVITIRDDGAGIDADLLRNKAVKEGLVDAEFASKLSRHQCYDLLFLPGFSTRNAVSEMSGRGVGMDVVKTRITELNGNVEIDSELGKGTLVKIRIPLTLAIMPTLMVRLNQRTFGFPLSQVREVLSLNPDNVRQVAGRGVIMVRGKPLPLVFLRTCLASADPEELVGIAYVVVLQVGSGMVGFVTDDVLGQEEVLIKPLGAMLQDVPGFAGATITGDGSIALIFDVNGLMKRFSQAA